MKDNTWTVLMWVGIAIFVVYKITSDRPAKSTEDNKTPVTSGLTSCLSGVSLTADGPSLVVTNNGDKTLTGIKVDLEVEQTDGDFWFQSKDDLAPGTKLTIGNRLFTRKDGLIFNDRLYRPKGISVQTDQGSYGIGDTIWCKDGKTFFDHLGEDKK